MYRPHHELNLCRLTATPSATSNYCCRSSTILRKRLLSNNSLDTQKIKKIYILTTNVYIFSCQNDSISRTNPISVAGKIAQETPNITVSYNIFSWFSYYLPAVNYLPPYQICCAGGFCYLHWRSAKCQNGAFWCIASSFVVRICLNSCGFNKFVHLLIIVRSYGIPFCSKFVINL